MTHTPGPLFARQVNQTERPFAVITPNGPHGDEIVAGYMTEGDAHLYAAAPDMLALLKELIDIEGPQPGTAEWARKVNAIISRAEGRE